MYTQAENKHSVSQYVGLLGGKWVIKLLLFTRLGLLVPFSQKTSTYQIISHQCEVPVNFPLLLSCDVLYYFFQIYDVLAARLLKLPNETGVVSLCMLETLILQPYTLLSNWSSLQYHCQSLEQQDKMNISIFVVKKAVCW